MHYDNRYDSMFEEFQLFFPATAEKAVRWYPSGRCEITIISQDGSKVRYNSQLQTIRGSYQDRDQDLTTNMAKRLRRKLEERRMTQKDLAEKIGVAEQTVSRYLKGTALPNVLVANHISEALDCTLSEIFEDY